MSKRKDADKAYQRAEDQRALVHVLMMAETNIEADAYTSEACNRVRANFLTVSEPPRVTGLAGQLSIDGTSEGDTGERAVKLMDVPTYCPGCNQNMLIVHGGSWTPLKPRDDDEVTFGPDRLQCGNCGKVVEVTEEAWLRVVDMRAHLRAADTVKSPVIPEKAGRTRGAG